MSRFPKIVALLAFLVAAGCRDSFPNQQVPPNVFYYPVGMAVRQMPADPSTPGKEFGWSQLVVVNSNFDLRYDEQTGGSVLVVDPDASGDTSQGGPLAVLGYSAVASFGGEVALVEGACQPGWPDCPTACPTLAADPAVAAGGAQVVLASRSSQILYRLSMDPTGALACTGPCQYGLPINRIDPYGVSIACTDSAGFPAAYAYVSHLLAANNLGWLTRLDLLAPVDPVGLVLGFEGTYTTLFDPRQDLLYVSSFNAVNAQFRWFNPLVTAAEVDGFLVPDYRGPLFSAFLPGAVARDMALSSDGRLLYVSVQLYDLTLAINTGSILTLGGAIAVFDLTPTAFAEPRMALLGLERTCVGAGQLRRLPSRPGKPDLFAITCDTEGALAIYDADARSVVRTIGLDPDSGLPVLGLQPFGIAVEPIDPRRATVPVQSSPYSPSPCAPGQDCQRIYVGSFYQHWVNILELDPDRPSEIALVKRIGSGP